MRAGRWTKESGLAVDLWGNILGGVEIGTEWNLKCFFQDHQEQIQHVEIGTEWNLKPRQITFQQCDCRVEIGTEWNLKKTALINSLLFLYVEIGTEWNLKVYALNSTLFLSLPIQSRLADNLKFHFKFHSVPISTIAYRSGRLSHKRL